MCSSLLCEFCWANSLTAGSHCYRQAVGCRALHAWQRSRLFQAIFNWGVTNILGGCQLGRFSFENVSCWAEWEELLVVWFQINYFKSLSLLPKLGGWPRWGIEVLGNPWEKGRLTCCKYLSLFKLMLYEISKSNIQSFCCNFNGFILYGHM